MHADKWAPVGGILAALCLLDVGAVTGPLTAIGLGFVLDDAILLPLLAALLGATIWTLAIDRRYHRSPWPSRLSWLGTILVFAGLWTPGLVGWGGVAALAGATVWNRVLVSRLSGRRRRAREVGQKLG